MAMKVPELKIRFDEQKLCFVVSASRGGRTRAKDEGRPFYVEWPVDELRSHPDSGERVIGAAVLAFFNHVSGGNVGPKDYRAEAEEDENRIVADFERSARNGDPSAQYSLALLFFRRAGKRKSLKDVKDAEKWLRSAAKNGNQDALNYLRESWPAAKKAVTDRIRLR